ncbi:bifunctional tRNA (5-methylaminomethyl-2-thiouridine)(34)-methyltransferase MnmD/FAD-dependent 5-carboxymethylaminomethyl-2-thiouridine(34) oxidoreductase MnmC [Campylobacter mucosalis]|uniref:bifunctional tRNA (5-methylaminomethyl-2-thiouridine)(34)-methyltransferase MnmD/FAD-dependent 5-carboxymethylaminomethyl-2-thiouridine(34) oxidoreductase MnmC n=1 Tax=Campylobacter mucosalis TaxID=202 RepID=UPI0014705BDE|nr:bifunctional tRNA (5-methylaminomethyl-2-thiouridine)(34)-methyltransferase MnmD/FAD-dependent 5-carboxymethylaminomethyl-2-thiouridine(34) oxidoreductase MnmC [Campylobacter mucosalis]
MKSANLSFKDDIAYSQNFDDIYFNTDEPQKESEYVFASAIDEIWHKQQSFIVAETGFGAGLNFITLAKKFKNSNKKLHFVSIEGYPLSKDELSLIYAKLGIYKQESKRLISIFPPRINGIHRIEFAPNITLDLCFGEVTNMIAELDFKADIWFLDGFAPSKNAAMWSEEIFNHISRLTRINGIARTYSCAKVVRENFSKAGFLLELRAGYGKKRQMSHAILQESKECEKQGYFVRATITTDKKDVLIIGAGVAGVASAFELQNLGYNVTIAEKMDRVATNGSSNHCGILIPLITKPDVSLGKMHINAFLQAVNFYKNNLSKTYINFSGAYEYAFDDELFKRYFSHEGISDEIFDFYRENLPYPAIFVKHGAYARPAKICQKIASGLNVITNFCYQSHKHLKNGKISVKFANKKEIKTDILIFATGSQSTEIFKNLPISFVRGQVTHIAKIGDIKYPQSAKGYITPLVKDRHVVGATYSKNENFSQARAGDDVENLQKISEFVDINRAEILDSHVAYRGYSSDRFPIIGALHDEEFYKQTYDNLFWSKNRGVSKKAKYEPNVFLNIAHGSRGLGTAILGAKLIADLIASRPLCIEKSLFNELHSARFLIRKLKKGIK